MKKIISIMFTLAIVAVFAFSLVACDKKGAETYEDLSAEAAESALCDSTTGAIILARKDVFLKADFTEKKDGVTIVGSASITEDNCKLQDASTTTPVAYRSAAVTDSTGTKLTEYYACYDTQDDGYGSLIKYYPFYFGRVDEGNGWEYEIQQLADDSNVFTDATSPTGISYNSYVRNCGVYDGRNAVEKVIKGFNDTDVYSALTYSGRKVMKDGNHVRSEFTLSYTYLDEKDKNVTTDDVTVNGTAKIFVGADGKISCISISEDNGYEYSASYTYNIAALSIPLVPDAFYDGETAIEWSVG